MTFEEETGPYQQPLLSEPPMKRRGVLFHATFILFALAVTLAAQVVGRLLIDGSAHSLHN